MSASDECTLWKRVIVKCLGPKYGRHCGDIMHNLLAVDSGVKPAYLIDSFVVQERDMGDLIETLLRETLLRNVLSVLTLEADCLVTNPTAFCAPRPSAPIMDVSAGRTQPALLCDVTQTAALHAVWSAVGELQTPGPHTLDTRGVNLSTVFGWLLGYPCVYWFRPEGGTCMDSMTSLCGYEVSAETPHSGRRVLYSFSHPCDLDLGNHVTAWFDALVTSSAAQGVFNNMKITSRTVVVPSLTL